MLSDRRNNRTNSSNVNDLLDNLRLTSHNPYTPVLRLNYSAQSTSRPHHALIDGGTSLSDIIPEISRTRRPAGPQPPPSWQFPPNSIPAPSSRRSLATPHFPKPPSFHTHEFRLKAFALVIPSLSTPSPPVPSLQTLCILSIVDSFAPGCYFNQIMSEDADSIKSMPNHIRRQIVREAAVFSPLSSVVLECLWAGNLGVEGEALLVGNEHHPEAEYSALLKRLLRPFGAGTTLTPSGASNPIEEVIDPPDSWDLDLPFLSDSVPLQALVLISLPSIPISLIPFLPQTITRLALINVTTNPAHQTLGVLSRTLPLLVVLDLSFTQLRPMRPQDPCMTWKVVLRTVKWSLRWSRLEKLGLRGCGIEEQKEREQISEIINYGRAGRWIDIVFE